MTPLLGWTRNKARIALEKLLRSSSPDVKRVGDNGSGWVICVNPPPVVAYCAGVGKAMTFEVELAKMTRQPVLLFDPSPTGINTAARTEKPNVHFFPIGLAANAGILQFSVPLDPEEGSYSMIQGDLEVVSFECQDLATIMSRNGDSHIDLLKMDIEGFEFDIVNQFLDQKIPVRQLCVEFHRWFRPGETLRTIARLYRHGYRIIYKQYGDFTFVLNQPRFAELVRAAALKTGNIAGAEHHA
jgi:FkbM family methyltransferase